MTERNRYEQSHGQQSSDAQGRDVPEMADDRGRSRDRRSFSGDREYDELGSEMEDDVAREDNDDMSMDDGLGGPDRDE
jgi:hypothetical protein